MTQILEPDTRAADEPGTAQQRVELWLQKFESALATRDIERVISLFAVDSYWRDLVAFTWNIRTVEGLSLIHI